MKAQCERCKEIVPLAFDLAEDGIRVHCGACGESYTVVARAPRGNTAGAKASPIVMVPRNEPALPAHRLACPKCGIEQERAPACRACGLIFAKWRGPEALADTSVPELGDARTAAALWAACEESWEDTTRHDAFVDHCQSTQAFAYGAQRYRARLAKGPPGDPVAKERLGQIRARAEAALLRPITAPPPADDKARYKGPVVVLLVVMAVTLCGLVYMLASKLGSSATP